MPRVVGWLPDGRYNLHVSLSDVAGLSSELGLAVGIKWFQLRLNGPDGDSGGGVLLACSTWGE